MFLEFLFIIEICSKCFSLVLHHSSLKWYVLYKEEVIIFFLCNIYHTHLLKGKEN